jgi:hypothetical protein
MTRFVAYPSDGARAITPADLDAAFDSVDATKGIASAKVGAKGWLEALVPASESAGRSCLVAMSPSGEAGAVFASRSSDSSVPGAQSGWAAGLFSFNDNTTAVKDTYGIYGENRRFQGTGNSNGIEWATCNSGTDVVTRTPFDILSGHDAVTFLLDAGRQDIVNGQDATAAMVFQGSGGAVDMRYRTGMIWTVNSLRPNPSLGGPVVLDMPRTFGMIWRNGSDGGPAFSIRSDSVTASGWGIYVADAGFSFTGPNGSTPLSYVQDKVTTTSLDVKGNLGLYGNITGVAGAQFDHGSYDKTLTVNGKASFPGGAEVPALLEVTRLAISGTSEQAGRALFNGGIRANIPSYGDDPSAKAAGLIAGDVYQNAGALRIVQ